MDIIDFAMKMELDGKAFYDKHARAAKSKDLKRIFNLLSEEEIRHYNFFKSMKEGTVEEAATHLNGSTETLKEVKNIFAEMSENKTDVFGDEELSAWKEALQIEEKAESFYREKAAEENDANKKRLLTLIAEEEQNHVHMIEGVLTYMKFPEAFADSQQFKDFQSLEGK